MPDPPWVTPRADPQSAQSGSPAGVGDRRDWRNLGLSVPTSGYDVDWSAQEPSDGLGDSLVVGDDDRLVVATAGLYGLQCEVNVSSSDKGDGTYVALDIVDDLSPSWSISGAKDLTAVGAYLLLSGAWWFPENDPISINVSHNKTSAMNLRLSLFVVRLG